MKKVFINKIGRRQFLKTSLSGLALATLPGIFFAGEATAGAYGTVHGANRSGIRAATDVFISDALD